MPKHQWTNGHEVEIHSTTEGERGDPLRFAYIVECERDDWWVVASSTVRGASLLTRDSIEHHRTSKATAS